MVCAVRGEGVLAHQHGMVQRLVQRLAVVVGVAVALVVHDVVHLHSVSGWELRSMHSAAHAGAAGGVQEAGRRRQKVCRLLDRHLVCSSAWPTVDNSRCSAPQGPSDSFHDYKQATHNLQHHLLLHYTVVLQAVSSFKCNTRTQVTMEN